MSICFLSDDAYGIHTLYITVKTVELHTTHLVHPYRLAKELDAVHDPTGIFGVFFRKELAEAKALMRHRDSVLRKMQVGYT